MAVGLTSLLFLLFGVIALAGFGLWIWALADALRTPEEVWREARQDRLVWVLVIALLTLVGALLFLAIARPELERAKASRADAGRSV